MSTATADAGAAPAAKGKKKLMIIIIAAVVLLGGGGGAAFVMMKKKAAQAAAEMEDGEEAHEEAPAKSHAKKDDHKAPPVFVPLEPFVVNLADKDAERYAQVGVTLEVDDPKVGESIKAYMPAIRNGILMVLAHKKAGELLEREGKEALAAEILREAVIPLGYDPDETTGKKGKKRPIELPVKHVHFSNFIIQ